MIAKSSERDWPNGDYWHRACSDCNHEFNGPKRAAWCWLCEAERCLALKTGYKSATHSEDGQEEPEVVGSLIEGEFFHCVQNGPGNNPLMTVAQHERIVAAKDAEIARLCKLAYIGEHQFEDCTYKFRLEELRAQPARQVGGDDLQRKAAAFVKASRKSAELEYLCAAELEDEGDADESASCANIAEQHEKAARLVEELARAALAPAAVVMPEYERNHAGLIVESVHSPWNAALDAVARLNRRAIPVGLLERISEPQADHERLKIGRLAAGIELRALLGEEK